MNTLNQSRDNPRFPQIISRHGAGRGITAVLGGTGIRVQTIVIAHIMWGQTFAEIAANYELDEYQVQAALDFYSAHRAEIDQAIEVELELEAAASIWAAFADDQKSSLALYD